MKTIQEIADNITTWREHQGFLTPCSLNTEQERDLMLGKLMLVTTEVAEAAEAVRHMNFPNFEEELSDAVIRLFDIMNTCGIDIEEAVVEKMLINKKRPYKHGKLCSL